ncbi:MAG: hypothetical protein QM490_02835 [Candidatus Gracilibacteria bacterium]
MHICVPVATIDEIEEVKNIKTFFEATPEQKKLIIKIISAQLCLPIEEMDMDMIEKFFDIVKEKISKRK